MDMQNKPRTAAEMRKIAEEVQVTIRIKPYLDEIEKAAKYGDVCKVFDVQHMNSLDLSIDRAALEKLGYKVVNTNTFTDSHGFYKPRQITVSW